MQTEVTDRMRGILIDWLIGVHHKFKLRSETLFITADLIDRFCGETLVLRSNFQLLGITALFIASKYEEIYPPELHDFSKITDFTYSKEEIMRLERLLLK